jgi:hypothetical protein
MLTMCLSLMWPPLEQVDSSVMYVVTATAELAQLTSWHVVAEGSGLSFHRHGDAWLVLLQGTKHWIMYPPPGKHRPSEDPPRPAGDAASLGNKRSFAFLPVDMNVW